MRILKHILSLLFVLVLVNCKVHSFVAPQEESKDKAKLEALKYIKTIHADQDEKDDSEKCKRRPRGIEVPVPQVPALVFKQSCTYRQANFPNVNTTYCSFQQFVHGTRGPPLA